MSKPETALAIPTTETMDVMQLGTVLAKSGYFQEAREAAQAVVKVLAGREMGFGPIASMTGVHIIKGKPSVGANLMAAAIKRSGRYDYKVRELTPTACKLEFFERVDKSWQSIGESSFSAEDAKTAGLAGGDNHKHFPRNMLFARAMSNGAKWYTPDIFGGPVYTPDELGALVNHETGEVIEGEKPTPYEPEADGPITPEQVKRFWAIARQHKWTEDQVKKLLNDHSHESSKDILRSEYEAVIERIKSGPDAKPAAGGEQQTLAWMGSTLPRVTHIIEAVGLGPDFSRVPPYVLEAARLRGSAVHAALEGIVYGFHEQDDPAIAGYLNAYRRFVREAKWTATAAEFEVEHPVWGYCGHPDVVGWLSKTRMILDAKTGATDGAEYQLAAYVSAYNHQHPTEPVTAAAVVELRENGTYRFTEVDLPAATPVWQAACVVYHARQRRAA